jgi:hypothetical protein
MVQKPPVDIEWYDDGFSMEEQAELRKQYTKQKAANRPKIQVTEEYHEKTKDKIISDLRQKLAADEEYIKELEETQVDINNHHIVIELREQLDKEKKQRENLQSQYATINKKYADLLNDPALGTQKYRDTIKELEAEVKSLKEIRDQLIYKLNLCSQ